MRFTRHAWPAIFAVLILIGIPSIQAQSTTSGYVTGSVTDASKAVIKGAVVKLENTGTSLSLTATSGDDGAYHFDFVPPGSYKIHVDASGFGPWEQDLTVAVGQSAHSKCATLHCIVGYDGGSGRGRSFAGDRGWERLYQL